MKRWQRDRNKSKPAGVSSIQSFFKAKDKSTDGVRSTVPEAPVVDPGADGGTGRRKSIGLTKPGVAPAPASEASEADTDTPVLPMSQGVGIVWHHSPAKIEGQVERDPPAVGEERKPLRDLMLCVAKPLESTRAADATKTKNVAIEELMIGSGGQEPVASSQGAPSDMSDAGKTEQPASGCSLAKKRVAQQGEAQQAKKMARKSLSDRLDMMRQGASTSGRRAKGGSDKDPKRNQALFDVLQKVEKAMAKKQQKKNGSKASTPKVSAVVTLPSKEALSTLKGMVPTKMQETGLVHPLPALEESMPQLMQHEVLECVVLEVFEWADLVALEDTQLASGMCLGDKLLRVLSLASPRELFVKLQGSWGSSRLDVGEEINLVRAALSDEALRGSLDKEEMLTVSDTSQDLLLVRYPGRLVTGTKLSTATTCTRQAVLDEKVQNGFGFHPAAVLGSMKHEIIQTAMTRNKWSKEFLVEQIGVTMKRSFEQLYGAAMDLEKTVEELQDFIPTVQEFMSDHMTLGMSDLSLGRQGSGDAPKSFGGLQEPAKAQASSTLDICEILDIEDYLTSTKYGVKGIVDVSLKGRVKKSNRAAGNDFAAGDPIKSLMPLEIKTGREYFNHRAQLVIYVLLMEDAYREKVDHAVMWYTGRGGPSVIPISLQERKHIIQARNHLAGSLEGDQLPPLMRDERTCSRCFQRDNCMGLHKLVEGGTAESSGIPDKFELITSQWPPSHSNFFQKWYRALCYEEEYGRNRSRLNRSSKGFDLLLHAEAVHPLSQEKERAPDLGHCYTFKLSKSSLGEGASHAAHILALGLEVGDRVRLKAQNLAKPFETSGRVCRFTPQDDSVDVIVPQPLKGYSMDTKTVWRVKKDQSSSLNGLMKGNLMDLVLGDPRRPFIQRHREVIIDKDSPKLLPVASRTEAKDIRNPSLNSKQKEAVLSVMNAEDYALILGTPGSGKSTVIVEIIKLLVEKGQSVLVTSHTNSAVDNILTRLIDENVDFVRIGNAKSVSARVKPYMVGGERKKTETFDDYKKVMGDSKVFGCTCYNMGASVFMHRHFDFCIVDEASQITLPAILGPLTRSQKFVLVGDNYQLPPLVMSPKAELAGLNRSLFVELAEAHPQSVIFFEEQYRMAEEISILSSSLIYCDRLRCGAEGGSQYAHVRAEGLQASQDEPEYLRACLDPKKKVVFIDTDGLGCNLEELNGTSLTNVTEADACIKMIKSFITDQKVAPECIGVMSVYNMQVSLIQQKVRTECPPFGDSVEVHTVDRFQGRDKSVVLVSFVRSNAQRNSGHLLLDWRRVNVALTRAKHKLILVGSASTLSGAPILDYMLGQVRARGSYVSLAG